MSVILFWCTLCFTTTALFLFTFKIVYLWHSSFFLMHFVFKHRLGFISHATLYLSHLALFWQGRNLFCSSYALNHDLYARSETKTLQFWLSVFMFSEVVFVNNRTCSVNFKGLSYDHYKHVSLIQGVFEFTKGMFVDILNICLWAWKMSLLS